jgi:predicted permease
MNIKDLWLRLRALARPRRVERELDEELQFHIEMQTRKNRRRGIDDLEARRVALLRFGGMARIAEDCRDARGRRRIENLAQDVRYGLRQFRRNPIFATVVVLSLALGIGVNTALFSVFDAKVFRKLPVHDPDALVFFKWTSKRWAPHDFTGGMDYSAGSGSEESRRSSNYFGWRALDAFRRASTLSGAIALTYPRELAVVIDGEADRPKVQGVSGNYFSMLGVPAAAGRTITLDDDRPAATPVAMMSHGFWKRRFGLDPAVVGKRVTLNGTVLTIIGVTAPDFRGSVTTTGVAPDLSIPLEWFSRVTGRTIARNTWWLQIVGRMRPGARLEQVRGDLEGVFQGIAREAASDSPQDVPRLEVHSASRGFDDSSRSISDMMTRMSAIFGLLLLIVCVNVANLLVARAASRRYEIGVRLSLGADRLRLIQQLLTESALLALIGGATGIVALVWGQGLLASILGQDSELIRIDSHAISFTVAISLVATMLFGLAPALQSSRGNVNLAVRKNDRRRGPRSALGKGLLVFQVASSVMLLAGAGLLIRTLSNVPRIDVGFDAEHVLLFRVRTRELKYSDARVQALYDRIIERIDAIPGVLGTTTSSDPLVSSQGASQEFHSVDRPESGEVELVRVMTVRANFFDVMGIPVVRGRSLTFSDGPLRNAPHSPVTAAVVNESLARLYFPDTDPIGRRFRLVPRGVGYQTSGEIEIVGVVKDVSASRVRDTIRTVVFVQNPLTETFAIRTSGSPWTVAPAIRQALREIDPSLPVFEVTTQAQLILDGFGDTRAVSIACGAFGAVGLALTTIGLYGLLAYTVALRTSEIGLRMALGAQRLQIVRLIVGQELYVVAMGLGLGVIGSLAFNHTLRAFIFGVSPHDPTVLGAVAALLVGVTSLAAYLPARRASLIDPTIALRYE